MESNKNSLRNAVSGSIAGLITRAVIAPLDVIKIRQQLEPSRGSKYDGFLKSIRSILKSEGISGFWKGNLPASYLYLTFGGAQFCIYYELESSVENKFLLGGIASGLATTLTYPLDLIRTRFSILGKDQIYKGLLESFSTIYKLEGLNGLYRGLSTCLITVMPSMGLLFYTHSQLLKSFDNLQISHLKFSAGFLSGMFTKSLLYPFDTIRKRLQIQGPHRNRFLIENVPKYTSTLGVVSQMIEHEGILSLYKGILPSILKSGLSSGMTFLVFDYCRTQL